MKNRIQIVLIVTAMVMIASAQPTLIPYTPDPTSDLTPTLFWNPVSGAVQYRIQIDNDVSFSSTLDDQTLSGATNYTPGGNLPEGNVYWRVSDDFNSLITFSAPDHFIITTAPVITSYTPDPTPDLTPTFYWSPVSGASDYFFEIADNVGFSTPLISTGVSSATTFTVSGPAFINQTYYWRVSCNLNYSNYYGYDSYQFLRPSLTPYPQDSTVDQTPTFTWNAYPGISSYKIVVDNDISFTTPEIFDYVSSSTSYTPGVSLANGKYFWRISTNYDYESYSVLDSFVIDQTMYPIINTYTPDPTPDLTPMLTWNMISGASSYNIQIDDDNGFASPIHQYTTSGPTSFYDVAPGALNPGNWYWRVSSSYDVNRYGPYDNFTIQKQTLVSCPQDTTADQTPTFIWNSYPGASMYNIVIDNNVSFASPEINTFVSGSTSYTPAGLLPEGKIFWQISNNHDYASYSDIDSFVIDINSYPVPIPFVPDTVTTLTPQFQWNAVSGATSYTLHVSQSPSFSPLVVNVPSCLNTYYNEPSAMTQGTYFWRVSSSLKPTTFSPTMKVTINTAPKLFAYTPDPTPVNNPTLSWNPVSGASTYTIEIDDAVAFTSPISDVVSGAVSYSASLPNEGMWYWHVASSIAPTHFSSYDNFTYQKPQPNRFEGVGVYTSFPNFSWSSYPGAYSYYIQIDDDQAFSTPLYSGYISSATSYNSFYCSGPATYYWRVSADLDYAAYSNVDSVRITSSPTLVSFSTDSLNSIFKPKFLWHTKAGATSYKIQVANNKAFSPFEFEQNTSSDTFCNNYSNELTLGKWYWRVSCNLGWTDYSNIDSVVIIDTTASWYVSTAGNPANAGTTAASPFDSISTALQRISAFDTIKIAAGNYVLSNTINIMGDSCITLKGGYSANFTVRNSDSLLTLVDGQGTNSISVMSTRYVSIDGITLRNLSGGSFIYAGYADYLTVINCRFYQCYRGVELHDVKYSKVINNIFTFDSIGVFIDNNSRRADIVNNTFSQNTIGLMEGMNIDSAYVLNNIFALNTFGIHDSGSYTDSIMYNDFYGNGVDYRAYSGTAYSGTSALNALPNHNDNISENPFFTDTSVSVKNYRLAAGSPCIDAGDPTSIYAKEPAPNGGRINLGAFGNTQWAEISGTAPVITTQPMAANVYENATITLTTNATGTTPITYQWQKSQVNISGATSTTFTKSPAALSDDGWYRAIAANSAGKDTTDSVYVKILQPIVITFVSTPDTIMVGTGKTFTASASGTSPLSYQWQKHQANISGATAASYNIPSVALIDSGWYRLIVSNSFEKDTSDSAFLRVIEPLLFTFSTSTDTVETGRSKTFSVSATGSPAIRYQWQKHQANISGATAASYNISSVALRDSGWYRVIVFNPYEKDTSDSAFLRVPEPVTITVQPKDTTILITNPASFSVTATGFAPLTYMWIKDRDTLATNSSTCQISSTLLSDAGYYYCVVRNKFDTVLSTAVKLSVAIPPVAKFECPTLSGIDSLAATFFDSSSGTIDKWMWNYGDGGVDTFTVKTNPVHKYKSPGIYTVRLHTRNITFDKDSIITKTNYITVYKKSVSTFSGSPLYGIDSCAVQFVLDSVSPGVTQWIWTYGDGNIDTISTATNPKHTYKTPAKYSVKLKVSGTGGVDSTIRTNYITVYTHASALFTMVDSIGIAPQTVYFTDNSSGDITTRAWSFGDNSTDTGIAPIHTYTSAGKYSVKLTVSGTGGTDSLTKHECITVYTPSVAGFSVSDTTGIAPCAIQFTNTSTGDINAWQWNFGDSATDIAQNPPPHTYATNGTYTVSLAVSGSGGHDTLVKPAYITIFQQAVASFSASDTLGTAPMTVTFTNNSSGDISSWLWDFGDGSTASTQHPSHTYTARGSFTVSLVAQGNGGSDSLVRSNCITTINAPPVLSLPQNDTLLEDALWELAASVQDLNNDTVLLSLSGAPSGMTVTQSSHKLSWQPLNGDVGGHAVTVCADDMHGGVDSAVIALIVLNVNDPPLIDSIDLNDTAYEDSPVSGYLTASDPDGLDSVFASISPVQSWLTISALPLSRGLWKFMISGTPSNADTGIHSIILTVRDKEGLSAKRTLKLYVVNTNDAPDTKLGSRTVAYGAARYRMYAVDDFDTSFVYYAHLTDAAGTIYDSSFVTTSGIFNCYPLADGSYYFSCYAVDNSGLADPTPLSDTLRIAGASTHTWADSGMWTMISVPSKSYTAAPFKAAGQILHWDESQQQDGIYKYYTRGEGISTLTGTDAYWIKLDSGSVSSSLSQQSLQTTGDKPIVMALTKADYGWNQIASPYPYPVKWNKTLTLWEWNPLIHDYEESDGILFPWEGYWVLTSQADSAVLSALPEFVTKAATRQSKNIFVDKQEWTFTISLASTLSRDADNLFGVSREAKDGFDPLDRPEPPRMGSEPYLFFAHPEWKQPVSQFASDIRRTWNDKVTIFQFGIAPCTKENADLKVSILGCSDDLPVYLYVKTPEAVVAYKPGMALTVKPAKQEQYRTVFASGDKDFLTNFPFTFVMNHPYPNPCRPRTTIRYTLPYRWESNGWLNTKPYEVKMIIYDARGRVINELVNRRQGPGRYTAVWYGKSDMGNMVASGAYFCRLTAGKNVSVKKIITLR